MAVAVLSPGRKQEFAPQREEKIDPLDQILKGLQIASTFYGIKHNIDQNDLAKLQQTKYQQDITAQEVLMKNQGEDLAMQKDPMSQQSVLYRNFSNKYSGQKVPETATAYDLRNIIDPKKLTEIEASSLNKPKKEVDLVDQQIKQLDLKKKQGESIAEKQGKTLPPATVESLASSNASLQALEAANKAMQGATVPTGPFMGRVSGLMGAAEIGDTGKGAKALDAQLKLNAQTIGKYLEGGKLTDMDIDRYKQMLPNMTDSPQAASEKTKLLLTLISNKQKSEIDGLTQAGYDVGRIKLYTPNMEQAGQQAIQGNPLLPSAQAAPTDLATKAQQILQQRAIKNKGISGIQR